MHYFSTMVNTFIELMVMVILANDLFSALHLPSAKPFS